jgi:hypothetical protein
MKTKIRATIVISVILFAAMPLIAFKCSENQLQTFDRATGHIINGLAVGRTMIPEFVAEGSIEQSSAEKIYRYLDDAARIAEEARRDVRAFKSFDGPAKARIALAVKEISASLARLNNEGVLHIKNEKAQRRLRLGLAVASLAAITIATELGSQEPPAETKPE